MKRVNSLNNTRVIGLLQWLVVIILRFLLLLTIFVVVEAKEEMANIAIYYVPGFQVHSDASLPVSTVDRLVSPPGPAPALHLPAAIISVLRQRPCPGFDIVVQPYPEMGVVLASYFHQPRLVLRAVYGGQITTVLPAVALGVAPGQALIDKIVLMKG